MAHVPSFDVVKPYIQNEPLAPLSDYQRAIANFAIMNNYVGLFLSVGAGKTLITLETLYELNPPCHVLIIGPKPVVRATWTAEIEKWGFPFRINSLIYDKKGKKRSKKDRHELYQKIETSPPSIWFINRELVTDLVNNVPHKVIKNKLTPKWPFGMVIIDEAQSFKSPQAKRFKSLASVRPQIWRLIELTGTPAPNGPLDLWALIYLLDQGKRLGKRISHYKQRWFTSTAIINNVPMNWKPRPGATDEIYNAISDITVSMKSIQKLLPPIIYNDVKITMSDDEYAIYKKMKDNYVLAFENGEIISVNDLTELPEAQQETSEADKGQHVAEAVNAAVLQAKLSQMASGAIYVDRGHKFMRIHERKLEALYDIIDNTDSPVLVAYRFQSDLAMILDYLHKQNIDAKRFDGSPEMVAAWNKQQIPVMCVQPAAAGHGLNLQNGGNTLVWYTLPWSLEEYIQTNGRLHRRGQQNTVIIHRLLCEKTIDNHILRALLNKNTSQQQLMDVIKLIVKENQKP